MWGGGKQSNLFTMLFGDLGELIQFFLGWGVFMLVFMAIPIAAMRIIAIGNPTPPPTPVPMETDRFGLDEFLGRGAELVKETEVEISALAAEVEKRKTELADLKSKIRALQLTPEQQRVVGDYQAKRQRNISFREWLAQRPVSYQLGVMFANSLFFYFLGRRKRVLGPVRQ